MVSIPKKADIFLCLLFLLSTVLLVGSFDSRLANSNGDDHPIVWARYFTHPEQWLKDGNFFAAMAFGKASLPNMLAVKGAKYSESIPKLLSWIYVFIQNAGIGIAFYFFSKCLNNDKWAAATIAMLSFAMCPWQLNLAYYPNMMHSPYPGHLVMPFIVFATYFLYQNAFLKMALLLSLGAVIHPSQALQFCLLAFLFIFLSGNRSGLLKKGWIFLFPLSAALAVPMFLVPKFPNPLTDGELIPSALLNPHLVPWNSTTFWPWGIPSLIAAFTLSALECHPFSKTQSKLKAFWWANLIALVLLGTLHIFGAKFKVLPIILLCPFRVSVINSVLLAPIGFSFLVRKLQSPGLGVAWAASSLLMFLLLSKAGFFWGLLIVLWIGERMDSDGDARKRSLWLVLVWWLFYWLAGRPLRGILGPDLSGYARIFLSPGYSLNIMKIGIVFLVSIGLVFIERIFTGRKNNVDKVLMLFAATFVLIQSYQMGQEAISGELKSVWEMQKWAKQSTSKESVFLMESGSWRGISDRQVQVVGYRKNQVLGYFRYRQAKEAEDRLVELYARFGTKSFDHLTDTAFLTFAKIYEGTHLVERVSLPKRGFKIAYENSDWRIYEFPRAH